MVLYRKKRREDREEKKSNTTTEEFNWINARREREREE